MDSVILVEVERKVNSKIIALCDVVNNHTNLQSEVLRSFYK